MPSNLNALIRYKTINNCLYGGKRKWSINELIEACSAALAEYRGRYEKVSERTVRDDLRVMKSDILGYNAPIKISRGLYYYSDPSYSIMKISITDTFLVRQVIKLLIDLKQEMNHPQIEIIINNIMDLCGGEIAISEEQTFRSVIESTNVSEACAEYADDESVSFRITNREKTFISWKDILDLI